MNAGNMRGNKSMQCSLQPATRVTVNGSWTPARKRASFPAFFGSKREMGHRKAGRSMHVLICICTYGCIDNCKIL